MTITIPDIWLGCILGAILTTVFWISLAFWAGGKVRKPKK